MFVLIYIHPLTRITFKYQISLFIVIFRRFCEVLNSGAKLKQTIFERIYFEPKITNVKK